LGRVSEEAKLKLFGSASHYLHLGLNETFGMTIVEAMAKGCVPVVPKSGAIPEFVPSILFYSDIEEAAQKIKSNVGDSCNFKKEIRKIAEGFREENFREKFTFYLNILKGITT
jgi:glycosyltransferase involved in cell wall biosynthesis